MNRYNQAVRDIVDGFIAGVIITTMLTVCVIGYWFDKNVWREEYNSSVDITTQPNR